MAMLAPSSRRFDAGFGHNPPRPKGCDDNEPSAALPLLDDGISITLVAMPCIQLLSSQPDPSLSHHGLLTLRMASHDFDNRYGTDTGGEIPRELLDHPPGVAGQAVSYEPTDPDAFRVMVRELPIERGDYAFLDLGSGKGRVVLLAAQAGFGQVIGAEASLQLHQAACRNAREWARRGNDARQIDFRYEDAAETAIPERPCVIYMFNPFRERTLGRVLLNIKWSLQDHPRDLWIVYYNPQFGSVFERAAYLARVTVGRGFQQGDYAIWRAHGEYRG